VEEGLEITVKELKGLIEGGAEVHVIDVREPFEYDFCHIAGSKLMPIRQISNPVNELSREEEYVFYCHVGDRSAWAVNFLRQLGFKKVKNLKGGIDQWAVEIDPSMPRY